MSWSEALKGYLGNTTYSYACLYTIDGKNCFGEAGSATQKIVDTEILNAVKNCGSDSKFQGITFGGTKFVYIRDENGIYAFKKQSNTMLFFYGAAFACVVFSETEPRVVMAGVNALKESLNKAGLV